MASAAAETARSRSRTRRVAGGVSAIVAADQLTKAWAVAALSDGPVSVVGDTVELRLARNPGSAFGGFQGLTPLLAVAAIVVAVLLVRAVRRTTEATVVTGLVLVLGGALGNLIDRLVRAPGFLRGHVVDFVAVGWFPVFNVADSCITIGASVLVVHTLWADARGRSA